MNRRGFLKTALNSALTASVGSRMALGGLGAASALFPATAYANPLAQRSVVQLTLDGGPDFRHLFVPHPDNSAYESAFWQHNHRAHIARGDANPNGNYSALRARYTDVSVGGQLFRVFSEAAWLIDKLTHSSDVGVAIICNMVGSASRDHVHSLLAMDYGRHDTAAHDFGRSGWGGRLADVLDGRVISLTRTPRNLCYMPASTGSNERSPSDNPLTILDARTAGLFDHRSLGLSEDNWNAHMSRAMSSYYKGLGQRAAVNHRIERVIDHERTLRRVGKDLADALDGRGVLDTPAGTWLSNGDFARQMRTLHDMLNYGSTALDLRVASIDLGGWDSHDGQKAMIEKNFIDLFGQNKGLHTLFDQLDSTAKQNTLLVINGEFGRQIKSNFDFGTDHGRGNTMLVIGQGVRTGVYGEMFPNDEIERMATEPSPEIIGRTTIEHLHKAIADWSVQGNSGLDVVNRSLVGLEIEAGLGLDQLFL